MRKKYLSALLFGALLFASAGTFTSCKDYDDDINNLQTQIDQVAKNLDDLKAKVDALGGWVENVSFADGVLSVTTGGKTVTYPIPDKGVNNVTLALDGNNLVLDVDGTKQTIALPEAETPEIPEIKVEDGILYVGDKEYPLTVDVDNNVTIVESTIPGNETYTVMVNGEEVTFAKAFADVRITLESANNGSDGFYFTEVGLLAAADNQQSYGIHWARASKDIAWDGPKGNIASGTLVVGQTTAAKVTVRPINFDLKAHENELTLVSSTGVVAPAKVVVYKSQDNGPLHSGSRADADITYDDVKQGDYVLGIQLNSDLTDRQVIESFATADGNHNVKYALALDGTVVTDYNFVIDTQLKADTQTKCDDVDLEKFVIGGKNFIGLDRNGRYIKVPTGTHYMSYLDGRIYDMKVELDPSSESDAAVYGVTINEDGTITAGANAEDRYFKLQVTLIDVNGNISETEVVRVYFEQEEAAQVTELTPMAYTVTPSADKSVLINLGDVFSSLSDEDAIALQSNDNIKWNIEDDDDTFVLDKWSFDRYAITYYADAACTQEIQAADFRDGDKVKSIKYAKIPVSSYNPAATLGEHLLSITLTRQVGVVPGDPANKTIKKVNVPVDVQLPAWDALFKKSSAGWSSDTYESRIVDLNGGYAQIGLKAFSALTATNGADENLIEIVELEYTLNGNEGNAVMGNGRVNDLIDLDRRALETNIAAGTSTDLAFDTMKATAEYAIEGMSEFTIKTEFNVHILSMFEGAELVWYDKDGNVTSPAVMDQFDKIAGTGQYDAVHKNGLALRFIGKTIEIGDATNSWTFTVNGINNNQPYYMIGAYPAMPTSEDNINCEITASVDGVTNVTVDSYGSTISPSYVPSWITITGDNAIELGATGEVRMNFKDPMGVVTSASIPFVKKQL